MKRSLSNMVFAAGLSALLAWPSAAAAQTLPSGLQPHLAIAATPFDQKLSASGFFDVAPSGADASPAEALFAQARSFRYVREDGEDHWQTPEETEARHAGDCEDKAVWLYSRLVRSGHRDVRLVIGKYRPLDKNFHVWVTLVDADGQTLLLDPTIQKRIWNIGAVSAGFYKPIFSYAGAHRFRHV